MVFISSPEQRPFLTAALCGFALYGLILVTVFFHPLFDENKFRLTLAVLHFPLIIRWIVKSPAFFARVHRGLLDLDKKTLAGYALAMCLSVYLCGGPFLRSVMFFFYGLPAFIILWPYACAKIRESVYLSKVAYVFLLFTLFQIIAPGLYIPPFLDGISGWSKNVSSKTNVVLSGLKLVRDDGREVWLSNAFTNPATFLNWTIRATRDTVGDKLFAYYFEIYKKNWDLLLERKTPNQRYLGAFAYPGHNPYHNVDYTPFPPERIEKIIYITESYNQQTMKLIERKLEGTYVLTPQDREPHRVQ